MNQEEAYRRCMETFAEQESLGEIGRAFVEIVQDSPLDSPQEDELIGRFRAQALGLSALFAEIRDVYLDLIVTLR